MLKIPCTVGVEFDLDNFEDIPQVIFLVEYDIPVSSDEYYKLRSELRRGVLEVAARHGLRKSEDTIEDYGRHFYFVFYHDKTWRE